MKPATRELLQADLDYVDAFLLLAEQLKTLIFDAVLTQRVTVMAPMEKLMTLIRLLNVHRSTLAGRLQEHPAEYTPVEFGVAVQVPACLEDKVEL